MHFGPLWDLDLSYDNSSERSLLRNMEAYLGLENRPYEKIIQRLWQDSWFATACNNRLNKLLDDGLQEYLILHIDSLRNAIWQTQAENFKVWPINQKVYDWEKHTYHTTYDEYISDLKSFINIHLPYLQQAFAERVTTDVRKIRADDNMPSALYDLNGRHITSPIKNGIYIQNHRKHIALLR